MNHRPHLNEIDRYWLHHYDAYQSASVSIRNYSEQHGLNPSSFGSGNFQVRCRDFYATAFSIISSDNSSLSGLSHTSLIGLQFLVQPLHRSGWRALAAI